MRLITTRNALFAFLLFPAAFLSPLATATVLDPTQPDQVRSVARNVAEVLMSMYRDSASGKILSNIPGLLTYPPYYWWEAGAMFGQLIDYWYYTGDATYNDMIRDGIRHQAGENWDFMPANQSKDEGNDDQLFWAFTLMSAAEYNFPNPPDNEPGWLAYAQSIFNQLNGRWDTTTCGGGVRWQIYTWSPGFKYKNFPSNGGFFHMAARLALYTGNDTYAKKAEEVFDWLENVSPLIDKDYRINDGSDVSINCTAADHTQWTYNYGIMIGGAAYMYNYTKGAQVWRDRLQGFLDHSVQFFPEQYGYSMIEGCELVQKCNIDQVSFKAYLARWFAVSAQLAPFSAAQILPHLRTSAIAAAQACVGTDPHAAHLPYACGNRWYWQGFDGNGGVGQQMSALAVISANLITVASPPLNVDTGGTSSGNPGLGTGGDKQLPRPHEAEVTKGSIAGAAILTIVAVVSTVGTAWWMAMEKD